jgi:uncharacterized protein YraI
MHLKTLATVGILATAALFAGRLPAEAARAVVVGNAALRTGPGTEYRVITRLRSGELVNVTSCARSRRWCHVQPRRFRSGWVASQFLDRVRGGRRGSRSSGICFFSNHGEVCLSR